METYIFTRTDLHPADASAIVQARNLDEAWRKYVRYIYSDPGMASTPQTLHNIREELGHDTIVSGPLARDRWV